MQRVNLVLCRVSLVLRAGHFTALVVSACALQLVACGGDEAILKTADGVALSAADIDRDPLRLMPAGALTLATADAPAVFSSPLGGRLLALAERVLPIPAQANFVPARDLKRVLVGLYSFSGVDFAGVAQGTFDLAAIEKAAEGKQLTPLGTPLLAMEYSKRTLYVSANIGFVLLTPHTAVFGNETGIRRVLDRLERGELTTACAPEIQTLLEHPGAPVALGMDAATDPQVAAMAERADFLHGMRLLRAVANFESPGFNVAATLTYGDEATAAHAENSIELYGGMLQGMGFVSGLFGGTQPLQRLEATTVKSSVQVVAAMDVAALSGWLDVLQGGGPAPVATPAAPAVGTPQPAQVPAASSSVNPQVTPGAAGATP